MFGTQAGIRAKPSCIAERRRNIRQPQAEHRPVYINVKPLYINVKLS